MREWDANRLARAAVRAWSPPRRRDAAGRRRRGRTVGAGAGLDRLARGAPGRSLRRAAWGAADGGEYAAQALAGRRLGGAGGARARAQSLRWPRRPAGRGHRLPGRRARRPRSARGSAVARSRVAAELRRRPVRVSWRSPAPRARPRRRTSSPRCSRRTCARSRAPRTSTLRSGCRSRSWPRREYRGAGAGDGDARRGADR